jgi:hypothetical protein
MGAFLRDVRYAARATTFDSLSAWTFLDVSLSARVAAQVVESRVVGENYFQMLRVSVWAGSSQRIRLWHTAAMSRS